jgi:hypothetical protein
MLQRFAMTRPSIPKVSESRTRNDHPKFARDAGANYFGARYRTE